MLRKAKGDQGGFRISPGATFQIFNLKSAVGEADFDSFQESNLRPLWTPHIPLGNPLQRLGCSDIVVRFLLYGNGGMNASRPTELR